MGQRAMTDDELITIVRGACDDHGDGDDLQAHRNVVRLLADRFAADRRMAESSKAAFEAEIRLSERKRCARTLLIVCVDLHNELISGAADDQHQNREAVSALLSSIAVLLNVDPAAANIDRPPETLAQAQAGVCGVAGVVRLFDEMTREAG